ncbi:MAG TPA: hypothetical protein VFH66_06720 [Mycobacteriales bacterium]|nr:hypothetical protein [Mycobacteriales bacterium]
MARWRAVPTAVSTAVGALAFLASTGLAIVLGAGLHVWSGPAAPTGLTGQGQHGPAAITGRVGGVVIVKPPSAPAQHPQVPTTTAPTVSLPFVPFVPAPAVGTPSGPATKAGGPVVSAPEVVVTRPQPGLRDLLGLRMLLMRPRSPRLTAPATGDQLRPVADLRPSAQGDEARPGQRRHGRGHPHRHPAADRPLPHGIAVGDGEHHPGGTRGHGHAPRHHASDGKHTHGHGRTHGGHGHGHRHD